MALSGDGLGELLQVSKAHVAAQSTDRAFSEELDLVAAVHPATVSPRKWRMSPPDICDLPQFLTCTIRTPSLSVILGALF